MNTYIFNNKKKLAVLVAVVIVCLAAFATVAYAYDAVYKDDVDQISLTPSETAKYIYVSGDLAYPGDNKVNLVMDVEYTSVSDYTGDKPSLTVTPYKRTITGVTTTTDTTSLNDRTLTVLAGTLTVYNKTCTEITANLNIINFAQKPIADVATSSSNPALHTAYSIFGNSLTSANVKFDVAGDSNTDYDGEYENKITISADDQKDVRVYIVGDIQTVYDGIEEMQKYFYPQQNSLTDIKNATFSEKSSTYLVIPGFSLTLDVSDINASVTGSIDSNTLTEAKIAAAGNSSYTLTFKTADNSAVSGSVVLNSAAVQSLGDEATLSITKQGSAAVTGATATYSISLTDNGTTVSSWNEGTEITVYLNDVDTGLTNVYMLYSDDTKTEFLSTKYSDGTLSFTTTHLSDYSVVSGKAFAVSYANGGSRPVNLYGSGFESTLNSLTADAQVDILADITTSSQTTLNRSVTINGHGNSVTSNYAGKAFQISNSDEASITFEDLIVANGYAGKENVTYGIVAGGSGAMALLFDKVTFKDFGYKGLFVQNDTADINLRSATVKDCVFDNTSNYYSTVDVVAKGGTTAMGGDHALQFDLRHNKNTDTVIDIENCSFTGKTNGFLSEIEVCDKAQGQTISSLTIRNCMFNTEDAGTVGDITLGSTPDGKGTVPSVADPHLNLQDFPVDISVVEGTVVVYRGADTLVNTSEEEGKEGSNSYNSLHGYEANPVKIQFGSAGSVNTVVGENGNLTVTVSGTASVSGYKSGIVINGAKGSDVTYTVSDAASLTYVAGTSDNVTVVLGADITVESPVNIPYMLVLDLNNKTISNEVDIWNDTSGDWSLISVSGDLTINGKGKVSGKANDCYAADIWGGGKLTINDGEYIGNVSTIYVYGGSLVINGGSFDLQQLSTYGDHRYEINLYDFSYRDGLASVSITGGSFVEYDPSNSASESPSANFVAEGYTVTDQTVSSKTTYTVVKATSAEETTE